VLRVLAICHNVVVERNEHDKLVYYCSSPDELAFVNFTKSCGFEFLGCSEEGVISVNEQGTVRKYQFLYELEFTSERKRMSLIIKDSAGQILLMTKGADDVIENLMTPLPSDLKQKTWGLISDFAKDGLRTLILS